MKQRSWVSAWRSIAGCAGCALWLCASVAAAQEAPPEPTPPPILPTPLSDEAWADLDAYVAGAIATFDVPGAAVALIENGQVTRVGTYGVLGVDDPAPVDADTRFMIGSLTKSMTTTLAATLVAEGRVDWDDAVSDYLPSFALSNPEWTPLVRLRDVLGHTSGVPRADLPLFIDFERPLGLSAGIADIPSLAAPGERFEYQNQVFAVGGFALARAAGARNDNDDISRTYQRLMQRRVFQPLGMTRTTLDFEAAIHGDNHAWPHSMEPSTGAASAVPIGFERFALPVLPAGAVWSSIDDLARYFAMHLREGVSVDGVRVAPAAELEETHTAQTVLEGSTGYGLGWGVSANPQVGKVLAHGGGTAGFISQLVGVPSLDYGWVVLTNSTDGAALVSAVGRRVNDLVFGLPLRDDADLVASHAEQEAALAEFAAALAPVDADAVTDYVGRYERRLRVSHEGDELVVETVYGALRFKAIPDVEGLYVSTNNFFAGVPVQLATDEQGRETLSISFQFDGTALVDPIVAARLERPAHPPHHHHGQRAGQRQRFDWQKLEKVRRWNDDARRHPDQSPDVIAPGLN
ncbi:MAG TPA: serine hydrolase domain-containing protein [Polyangiaceae bacterium]|nr:serine hydrolase domain-containing protein [Polyangiaceae bacterium]